MSSTTTTPSSDDKLLLSSRTIHRTRDEIQIRVKEMSGNPRLDIRSFYDQSDPPYATLPTKKGLNLTMADAVTLNTILTEVLVEAGAAGLLEVTA
jgi:hypothetical protein